VDVEPKLNLISAYDQTHDAAYPPNAILPGYSWLIDVCDVGIMLNQPIPIH
jgi:hypothetical protein